MRIASVLLGVVGGVVLLSCLLTIFLFPPDSMLLWGKVTVGTLMLVAALVLDRGALRRLALHRGTAFTGTTVLYAVGWLAVLVALNVLAREHKVEVDLTRDRVYTLSEQTQKLLRELDSDVEILAFFGSSEPETQVLEHMIGRYRLLNSHLHFERVDPALRPDLVETYKITEESPRVLVRSGAHEARFRELNEQGLTNALLQVTQTAQRRVYFLLGHGEASIDDQEESGLHATAEDLRAEGIEVLSLNLIELSAVPDDATAIVVAGPRSSLLAPELEVLSTYLGRGGKLLLLLEPSTDPGLREWLRRYHLGYRDDTVLDSSPYGELFGIGPDAAIVYSYADHPLVRGFQNNMSVFSGARSVQTIDEGEGVDPAVNARVLFASSARSWGETDLLAGDWTWNEGEARGPVPLAAVATRNTSTVDAERKLSDEMRLLLVGDASFIDNKFRSLQINRDLFLSMVAWLTEQENHVAIRPRQRGASRIVLGPEQEGLIAFFALDGLPVAVLASGLAIWLVRRRR
ncbi:MAG: Gldg family protein [Pseudomonadota bacterium]